VGFDKRLLRKACPAITLPQRSGVKEHKYDNPACLTANRLHAEGHGAKPYPPFLVGSARARGTPPWSNDIEKGSPQRRSPAERSRIKS
jgi:hypothetical protein